MQAHRQFLLSDAGRAETRVQVGAVIPVDVYPRIAEFLNLRDFTSLRLVSKTWNDILEKGVKPQLLAGRTLAAARTRSDLQRLLSEAGPSIGPFFNDEVGQRLARIDGAEVVARRTCCANRILMGIGIVGLFLGGILIATGEHQHISEDVTAGIVIMAVGAVVGLVSVFCGRLTERHGRTLDVAGVPRPDREMHDYGSGGFYYSGI
jgi:hypothetical protein